MSVTPMNQLLLTLRFCALGSMIITVGDFCGVHKSTACRILHRVTSAIADLARLYIKFPSTPGKILEVRQGFYNIARFPKVIGAIDCTHVKIQSPGGPQAEYYRNRKGFMSINVQTICDAKLKILDIIASFPGATHDTSIFNGSSVKARFEEGLLADSLLVGDGGYPVLPYLITPLENPVTAVEQLFNESQIRTRNPVERKYGVWKRRFPVPSLGMRVKVQNTLAIIIAVAVLHNVACEMNEAEPPNDADRIGAILLEEDEMNEIVAREVGGRNNRLQQELIYGYFARLQ